MGTNQIGREFWASFLDRNEIKINPFQTGFEPEMLGTGEVNRVTLQHPRLSLRHFKHQHNIF